MAKPKKCISVAEAKTLRDNWHSTRAVCIEEERSGKDCSDVSYSVAELEEFLNYVKEESKKQGVSNPGVRIYFGAYDDNNSDMATVFLAPIKGDDAKSNNYDIDPFNFGGNGWPPNIY